MVVVYVYKKAITVQYTGICDGVYTYTRGAQTGTDGMYVYVWDAGEL